MIYPDRLLIKLYPIGVYEDRYGGCYSGGDWIAVAQCDEKNIHETEAFGSDIDCADWWGDPPKWVAVGNTPDEAINALIKKVSTL